MAKSRKTRPARAAGTKKHSTRTKREKVSRRMTGTRKAVAKAKKVATRRPARARPKKTGVVGQVTSTMQTVMDAVQEAREMRERMGPRGGLSEG